MGVKTQKFKWIAGREDGSKRTCNRPVCSGGRRCWCPSTGFWLFMDCNSYSNDEDDHSDHPQCQFVPLHDPPHFPCLATLKINALGFEMSMSKLISGLWPTRPDHRRSKERTLCSIAHSPRNTHSDDWLHRHLALTLVFFHFVCSSI